MAELELPHSLLVVTSFASDFDGARRTMLRAWRDYVAACPEIASDEIAATVSAMQGILACAEIRK